MRGEKGSLLPTDTGKVLLLLLESLSVETLVKVSNGKLFLISNVCMTNSSDVFRAFRGEISPPKQSQILFVFLDVFTFSLQFLPLNYIRIKKPCNAIVWAWEQRWLWWCKNQSPIQLHKPLINKNCQKW